MKKILPLLLALLMMAGVAITAFAASPEMQTHADALNSIGLFGGTGVDKSGNPIYELDRTPNRYEAVTMLVRLLGKEAEAKAGSWETPFVDVVDWAKPYVGYAYNNGLTSGMSVTTFGGASEINPTQYLTFVLRALRYVSGKDFEWDKAWELTDKLAITTGQYNEEKATFTRGDVVEISYNAMFADVQKTGKTLFESLKQNGIVSKDAVLGYLQYNETKFQKSDEKRIDNNGNKLVELSSDFEKAPSLLKWNYFITTFSDTISSVNRDEIVLYRLDTMKRIQIKDIQTGSMEKNCLLIIPSEMYKEGVPYYLYIPTGTVRLNNGSAYDLPIHCRFIP